jgi:hypothetical protein
MLIFDGRPEEAVDFVKKDGKATISRGFFDSEHGTSWVEGDMLCNQWQTLGRGIKNCAPEVLMSKEYFNNQAHRCDICY